jgi:Flp pilus assembly protein TadD
MTPDMEREARLIEGERRIANGAIGKALGLERTDLRFGLDMARSQLQRGALDQAFRTYIALMLCDPSDAELQIGLANCAVIMGENALALHAASAAAAFQPTDPRGFYLAGRAHMAMGSYDAAQKDLATAIDLARKKRDSVVFTHADKLLTKVRALAQ